MSLIVLRQMLRERWRSILGWSVGAVTLVVVMQLFYPSVRDAGADFDAFVEALPPSLRDTMGLSGATLSSPAGYLMSQLYANIYPLVILVMGFSMAAWAIAGTETDGTLEMTLGAPLTRRSLAIGRLLGVALFTGVVVAISTGVLVALSPVVDLSSGIPAWGPWGAALTMWAMALLYSVVAFAIGAATGRKAWALAGATVLALVGFLGQVFASLASSLEFLRTTSPWYWFLGSDPLTVAPGWVSLALPLALAVLVAVAGIWRFDVRDLRSG